MCRTFAGMLMSFVSPLTDPFTSITGLFRTLSNIKDEALCENSSQKTLILDA